MLEMEAAADSAARRIAARGLPVSSVEVRRGDKASELLKHLVVTNTPSTIVWGGDKEAVSDKRAKRSGHWFARVAGQIHCPIVTPVLKNA